MRSAPAGTASSSSCGRTPTCRPATLCAYYDLAPLDRLTIQTAPVAGPAAARRIGYLSFAIGRVAGPGRADVVFTRDLGVASLLLRLPRSLRPPLVYESHGYAPDVAAALPQLIATAQLPATQTAPAGESRSACMARRGRVCHDHQQPRRGSRPTPGSVSGRGSRRAGRDEIRTAVPELDHWTRGRKPAADMLHPDSSGSVPEVRRPVVAYAGHLYAWKGVDVLLEALALVPDVDGLIVGGHAAEPDLERVKAVAGRLEHCGSGHIHGAGGARRVAELLRSATILVLPNPASAISDRFTSPLKLFEYMAAGGRLSRRICRRSARSCSDGVNARAGSQPGDAAAIAAAITRLLDDSSLAARLARAAAEASLHYSWERRAERLEDLFNEVSRRPLMISESMLALVRCPDCHGVLAGPAMRWCAAVRPRVPQRLGLIFSICGRGCSTRNRPNTWTSRSMSTPATNGSRRRCSDRRSATTCCAPSSRRSRHDLVVDLGCGSGRTLLWNRDWGAQPSASTSARSSPRMHGERSTC